MMVSIDESTNFAEIEATWVIVKNVHVIFSNLSAVPPPQPYQPIQTTQLISVTHSKFNFSFVFVFVFPHYSLSSIFKINTCNFSSGVGRSVWSHLGKLH